MSGDDVGRPGARRADEATPRGDARPRGAFGLRVWTVGELTRLLRGLLHADERLRDAWVEGEVGQVSVSAAGHCYFTLKDDRAQLRCVLFREQREASAFEPQTGLRLVVHGRLDLFELQGVYQLYVDGLQPSGFGGLALRFEALKAKLSAEGLFEAARKRPLPPSPRAIGVATSATGAVLHDVRHVLGRRWPLARLVVAPCQVQGDGAPASIVAALRRLPRWVDPFTGERVEVIILARGGGSMEDLWPFNDERVVRAVAGSPVPLVSAVGHETDVTLVDFAADVRAPTPSAAAALVVPDRAEALLRLQALRARADAAARRELARPRQELVAERRLLAQLHPRAILAAERERAGLLLGRATRATLAQVGADRARVERAALRLPMLGRARLARAGADLHLAGATLGTLSPYATLERGYAIVRTEEGRIVVDAAARRAGDRLDVRLARGALDVRVERVRDSPA